MLHVAGWPTAAAERKNNKPSYDRIYSPGEATVPGRKNELTTKNKNKTKRNRTYFSQSKILKRKHLRVKKKKRFKRAVRLRPPPAHLPPGVQ